jgi:hypothetical protein
MITTTNNYYNYNSNYENLHLIYITTIVMITLIHNGVYEYPRQRRVYHCHDIVSVIINNVYITQMNVVEQNTHNKKQMPA